MKVWVTKYWDTQGLYTATVRSSGSDARYVYTVPASHSVPQQLRLGRDAFQRPEDAVVHMREQRTKKIERLKAQIAKLEKMKI